MIPQHNTRTTCWLLFVNRPFQFIITVRSRPEILPPRPARRATRITPINIYFDNPLTTGYPRYKYGPNNAWAVRPAMITAVKSAVLK
jgi:hypothetical protein